LLKFWQAIYVVLQSGATVAALRRNCIDLSLMKK
jgi:hypothetical protein